MAMINNGKMLLTSNQPMQLTNMLNKMADMENFITAKHCTSI